MVAKNIINSSDVIEFNKNTSCYYATLKPIFIALKILYKFPYQVTNQGKFKVKYLSLWMLYTIAIYGLLTYPTISIILDVYHGYLKNPDMENLLMAFATTSFMLFHFQSMNAFGLESIDLARYLNSWNEFEEEYRKVFRENLKSDMHGWIRMMMILLLPSVFLFLSVQYTLFASMTILKLIALCANYFSMTVYLLFFSFTCHHVGVVANHLKQQLRKTLLSANPGERAVSLSVERVLWVKLSDLVQDTGGSVGRTLMMMIIIFVLVVIITSYNTLITLITWSESQHITPYFVLAFVYFFIMSTFGLYLITASAHAATEKVGMSFATDLFNIDMSTVDHLSKFNILEFIQAVFINNPKIEMAGFFTINRQLFITYFSSTITYLIALGQFKVSEEKVEQCQQ